MLTLRPISIQDAKSHVAKWHRHNKPPQGGLFAVAVASDSVCGVAIVGRPVARRLDDGWSAEIIRVATDGTYNACSILYGACLRAAKALGYRRVFTYTLQSESGASLRAVGFLKDAELEPSATWSVPSRPRMQTDLFGNEQRPTEAKFRWVWRRQAGELMKAS
jgi:hypothetical protein